MCPHRTEADREIAALGSLAGQLGEHQVRTGRAERLARRFFAVAALVLAVLALAAVLIPVLIEVSPRVAGAISWRPTAIGAGILLGLLLWELKGAWLMLLAGVCLLEVPMFIIRGANLTTLATFSQTLLVGLLMGFVGTIVLRLSRSADTVAWGRKRATAAAAAAAGTSVARARAAALVHDEVLSTLNLAGSAHLVDREALSGQANRARKLLADVSNEQAPTSVVAAIAADVNTIDPEAIVVAGEGQPDQIRDIPPAVFQVVQNAVRQALQNSLLHAGAGAHRRVSVEHSSGLLRIVIHDDGIGFDPGQVSVRRLGLRTSAQAVKSVGGDFTVRSGVGSGAKVTIEWPGLTRQATGSGLVVVRSPTPIQQNYLPTFTDHTIRLSQVPLVRVGVAVTAATFAMTQLLLAVVAAFLTQPWWSPLVLLIILLAALMVLQHRCQTTMSPVQTALAAILIAGAMAFGLMSAPFEVGQLWFTGAVGFLLAAMAFRGRPGVAVAGGLLFLLGLIASGVSHGVPVLMMAAVSVRPLGVTAIAVTLTLAVLALLRHISRDFAVTEAASARESWEGSVRGELAVAAAEVRELVDDVLGDIASGTAITPELRARSGALEGFLRDRIRAGRLALEPLLGAVMRARLRGVDVVLLDDREGDLPAGFNLPQTAAELAAACDSADSRVTVRLLPASRSSIISLVVDGIPVNIAQNH